MSALDPRLTRWLVWIAPFAVLALVVGWQTGWGTAWRRDLPPDVAVVPAPVNVTVLPEYRIEGGLASMSATVDRPLFNATRRPAPAAVAVGAKPSIQRGQFLLTGTIIVDNVAFAFLKEIGGTGRSRSVKKGDSINGMLVAAVEPDRVRFSVGDETEELELKVAKGPSKTTQPAESAHAAAPGARPGGPAAPGAAPGAAPPVRSAAQGGLSGPGSAQENLRANRRAARAAEAQTRNRNSNSGTAGEMRSSGADRNNKP